MRVLVLSLQHRAVPPMLPELKLALVNSDLYALYSRRGDVRVACANVVLCPTEAWVCLTDGG